MTSFMTPSFDGCLLRSAQAQANQYSSKNEEGPHEAPLLAEELLAVDDYSQGWRQLSIRVSFLVGCQ